ncbi:LysR family transcriptional regulator [Eikenella sp. NML96-A-049]|uniref:LysR substrate-binding domain-containing protein n=1 Tax=unclassified Eikenella TaxID=2639367 RepID=UPI0007E208EA|nr:MULTISPECIES: LysR substrate-binding domain-containing protein [unclassified Eikenella]OAM34293.1 LysR family transcriptional regulator [Eikenella sp. NML070372]OAM39038.1 LysR family transcriptional regulator [Eikenella sp. NML96-A-049]
MINFRLIRHLWMFLAVAEEEHFGRAAERLNMSQPPLTEHIKQLEQALGMVLFERSRRGTKLTAAGYSILPAVRKFAEQMQRLQTTVQEIAAGHSGILHIGAITVALLEEVPPLIEHIHWHYPALTVRVREIDSGDAEPLLQAGDIDLAFARLEIPWDSTIRLHTLRREPLAVVLPKSHPFAKRESIDLKDLACEGFVMFERAVSPGSFDALLAACQCAGFVPNILHEVRTIALQVAFAGCGQGVALVPVSSARYLPGNAVLRPLDDDIWINSVVLAWHERQHDPLLENVLDLVQGYFDDEGEKKAT